jgi:hypothetical protein
MTHLRRNSDGGVKNSGDGLDVLPRQRIFSHPVLSASVVAVVRRLFIRAQPSRPFRQAQGWPFRQAQGRQCYHRCYGGGEPFDWAHGKPFDWAHGKPFDSAHGKPFDSAHGKPFDSAHGKPFDWVHGWTRTSLHRTRHQ